MLINKAFPFNATIFLFLPAHAEILLIGWTMQFVLAVAFWMFPRYRFNPKRGQIGWAWLAIVLLNSGVWIVAVASFYAAKLAWLGKLFELTAALSFAFYVWGRVKATDTGKKIDA